jgi:Mannosylglycerate hydrolase MGH1-like glycoside hydrolase domain
LWPDRLRRVLQVMLDEREFFSDYGVRALSRRHLHEPFNLVVDGHEHQVSYEPAESSSGLFGGNSNWRGPIWFPVNFLLVEALQKYHHYLGDDFRVACPTDTARLANLSEVATELSQRLTRIFLRGADGQRPVFGGRALFNDDPHWQEMVPFHEYFNGDTGAGVGASHQTGWTALVAKLLQQSGEHEGARDRRTTAGAAV